MMCRAAVLISLRTGRKTAKPAVPNTRAQAEIQSTSPDHEVRKPDAHFVKTALECSSAPLPQKFLMSVYMSPDWSRISAEASISSLSAQRLRPCCVVRTIAADV